MLEVLHSERFCDTSPAEVVATLLDEDRYLASERTMYRLLQQNGEVRERRDQLRHPAYARPELLAKLRPYLDAVRAYRRLAGYRDALDEYAESLRATDEPRRSGWHLDAESGDAAERAGEVLKRGHKMETEELAGLLRKLRALKTMQATMSGLWGTETSIRHAAAA